MPQPVTASSRSIEEAALRAWPAAQQLLFDGWVARLSDGYTKRANSALLLYPREAFFSPETIERIERRYRSQGLPAIFRLQSFSTATTTDREKVGTSPHRPGRSAGASGAPRHARESAAR